MRPLVMIGAGDGSLPRIIAEAAAAAGAPLAGYIDFGEAQPPAGPLDHLGDEQRLSEPKFVEAYDLVVSVQGPERRRAIAAVLAAGARLPVVAHPSVIVSPSAQVGAGTVLSAGVIVQQDARIGRFCVLNTACSIDHDNVLGDEVNIAPGVHTAGRVTIEDGAFVGLGAVIINNVVVGRRATVGAGAVVTRNVPEGATVVGAPARVLPPKGG